MIGTKRDMADGYQKPVVAATGAIASDAGQSCVHQSSSFKPHWVYCIPPGQNVAHVQVLTLQLSTIATH